MPSAISVQEFYDLSKKIFVKHGFTEEEASFTTDEIVEAQCQGIISHGAGVIPFFVEFTNETKRTGSIEVVRETPNSAKIVGNNNNGVIVARKAMELAMEKAEASGIGFIGVSNHAPFILGSYNPVRAAKKGFVAMHWTGTRGEPLIVPAGGADPILSVGPISIAIPSDSGDPIVLDMTWGAAGGAPQMSIPYYHEIHKPLPAGWAITREGLPTINPKEALEGGLLAIGGAKGAAVLTILEFIARGLLGEVEGEDFHTSLIVIVIRPDVFVSQEEFSNTVSRLSADVRNSRPQPGVKAVQLPGDRGHQWIEIAKTEGLKIVDGPVGDKVGDRPVIPKALYEKLLELAK